MRVQARTCTHMRVRVRDISVRVLRVWVRAGDGCVSVRGSRTHMRVRVLGFSCTHTHMRVWVQ